MPPLPVGATAVIFTSTRTPHDDAGYVAAAEAMDALAAAQPGYLGVESARGPDGFGITVSYWIDEGSAVAWRQNLEHSATRELGRERWYESYHTVVTQVRRAYRWERT